MFSGAASSTGLLTGGVPGLDLLEIVAYAALLVAVGSAVARGGPRSRLALAGAATTLAIVFARFVPTSPVDVVALMVYTGLAGAPWFVIGHRLTDPPAPSPVDRA